MGLKGPMLQAEGKTGRRYVIITPCRDEEPHIEATIEAVVAQTAPPARWVIADDRSKDRTPEIPGKAAEKHPFLQVVTRGDRAKGLDRSFRRR